MRESGAQVIMPQMIHGGITDLEATRSKDSAEIDDIITTAIENSNLIVG
jgi:hypothetical protein